MCAGPRMDASETERGGTMSRKVAIVMGSKSDAGVAEKAQGVLNEFGIES